MPQRRHFQNVYIIGQQRSETEPVYRELKALRKMVVYHYAITGREVREIEASYPLADMVGAYELLPGKRPWVIHVQLVGAKEAAMIEVIALAIDRAIARNKGVSSLVPYWVDLRSGAKATRQVMKARGLGIPPKIKKPPRKRAVEPK